METESSTEQQIRNVVKEEVSLPRRCKVTKVYTHTSPNDSSNHEADVVTVDGTQSWTRVPIMAPLPNMAVVPDLDADTVPQAVVEFFDDDESDQRPYISGWVYTATERAPTGEQGDVFLVRGDLAIEMAGDGSVARITRQSGDSPDRVVEVTDGGTVRLGDPDGNLQPVARKGDSVEVTLSDGSTGTGEITSGSANVESS